MSVLATLLLVDDDADDRELFLYALSKLPLQSVQCETAAGGPEALQQLADGIVSPDLIFLDLNMPMMNGYQVLRRLKSDAATQDIPVVILSTASDSHSVAQAQEAGASGFFTKPIKMAEWNTMLYSAMSMI